MDVLKVRVEGVLEEQLHIFLKSRLVPLQCQDVNPLFAHGLRGDLLLAAHRVNRHCTTFEVDSLTSSGIAVISLDFSSQATCPSVSHSRSPRRSPDAASPCPISWRTIAASPCHQC